MAVPLLYIRGSRVDILTIRSLFEKRGCQAVLVVVAILLGIGLIAPMLMTPGVMGGQSDGGNQVLLKTAGQDVTAKDFSDLIRRQPSRAMDPLGRLQEVGMQINTLIEQAALRNMAAQTGARLSDEDIVKLVEGQLEMNTMIARMQMQGSGQLKPNATDKDFDEAFKKQTGSTPAEFQKRQVDQIRESLKDPAQRKNIEESFIQEAVVKARAGKVILTENDLKKGYDTFFLNRLAFDDAKIPMEQRKAQAEKARKELEGGKPFAQVHQAYAKKPAAPPEEMTRSMLETDPSRKALTSLQPKGVSPVMDVFGSPTVYQLIKIEQKLPPDFEKNKATLLTQRKESQAREQVTAELKAAKDGASIEWKAEPLKVLYAVFQAVGDKRPTQTRDTFYKLYEEAEAAYAKEANEYLALARYVALDEAYRLSTTDRQAEMREARAESLVGVLEYVESANLRMELVQLYVDLKQNDEAADAMLQAANINSGDFESPNESMALQIETRTGELEKSKVFTKEQADAIRQVLVTWRKDKAQADKEKAELAKMEAEEKVRQEAEEKKMREEELKREAEEKKKAAEEAKKAPASPTPPSPSNPLVPAPSGGTTGGR